MRAAVDLDRSPRPLAGGFAVPAAATAGERARVGGAGGRAGVLVLLAGLALALVAPAGARADARRPASRREVVRRDWPCRGCVVVVPRAARRAEGGPRPLLVALHGDDAGPEAMLDAWRRACRQAGVILFAPACPEARGCRGSWWRWQESTRHDPAWLVAQIDAVRARHAVDPARVYAAGWSGGSAYVAWLLASEPRWLAAAVLVSGGHPYTDVCPACAVPVRILVGGRDFLLATKVEPLRRFLEGCGDYPLEWEVLPGVTHREMPPLVPRRAPGLLRWLLARRNGCPGGDMGGDGATAPPAAVEGGRAP